MTTLNPLTICLTIYAAALFASVASIHGERRRVSQRRAAPSPFSVGVRLDPRHCWLGIFWKRSFGANGGGCRPYEYSSESRSDLEAAIDGLFTVSAVWVRYQVYVCLLPMLPIVITATRGIARNVEGRGPI